MKILNLDVEDVEVWKNDETSGVHFVWDSNIGFGELDIYSKDGIHWKADTETMCDNEDKEFIKMIFKRWLEQIEVVG